MRCSGSGTSSLRKQKPSPRCHLVAVPPVSDPPCSSSTCSQSSGQAATSFLTSSSCPIFKFLTYSLNLLALVPLHALACRSGTWLRPTSPSQPSSGYPPLRPLLSGSTSWGKSLLPAEQDMDVGVQSWEQWEGAVLSSKALLRWWQKWSLRGWSRMGKEENIPNKAESSSKKKIMCFVINFVDRMPNG